MNNSQRAARIVARSQQSNDGWYKIRNSADNTIADVMIYDEIGFWGVTAADFVQELQGLEATTINVHVNSPGGDVFDGLAIYNTLKQSSAQINMIVEGLAASAASFIVMAGDDIQIARNAMMMIHDAAGLVYGNAAEMSTMADLLNKTSDNVADIYSQRAGGSTADWRAVMQEETWYSSAEALAAGLVDSVQAVDGESDIENKFKNQLSVFNYAGRNNAPSPFLKRKIENKSKENSVTDAPGQKPNDPADGGAVVTPPAVIPPIVDTAKHSHIFNVGGKSVTDFGEVQAHINNLESAAKLHEQFENETKETARKGYVEQLAKDNKILQSAVKDLTDHALSLNDDQYEGFKKIYDATQVIPILSSHGQPNGTGSTVLNGPGSTISASDQRKKDLEAMVKRHRSNNVKEADIQNMASYKELQQILAAEKNS